MPRQDIADRNFGPISVIVPNMKNSIEWLRKYQLLKTFNVNVDAEGDANTDTGGSA